MRFIVDECTGPTVSNWLTAQGHDVYSVSLRSPGWKDSQVLAKANEEKRIIVTNDRDFGELIYKFRQDHEGVIFLRLSDETIANKKSSCNACSIYTLRQLITKPTLL